MTDPYTAVGVFSDLKHAEQAVADLRRAGFPDEHIGFMVRTGATPAGASALEGTAAHIGQGAAAGALVGGGVGAVAGIAVAAGAIPAVGPAIAGGVLAGILASTATGATAGGLLGALIGLGIPPEEAHFYERELRAGKALVSVRADNRYPEAAAILRRHGGYDARGQEQPATRTAVGLP